MSTLTFRQHLYSNGKWIFNTSCSQEEVAYSRKQMKNSFNAILEDYKRTGYEIENLSTFGKRIYYCYPKDDRLPVKISLC